MRQEHQNGGVVIRRLAMTGRFERDYKRLDHGLQGKVDTVLLNLTKNPRSPMLRFEKLGGYRRPSIHTVHVTPNHSHKLSFEIDGDTAILRRIGTHKEIDGAP